MGLQNTSEIIKITFVAKITLGLLNPFRQLKKNVAQAKLFKK